MTPTHVEKLIERLSACTAPGGWYKATQTLLNEAAQALHLQGEELSRLKPIPIAFENMFSVVYRSGSLTPEDYDEAIEALQNARTALVDGDSMGCRVCEDSGHGANQCHHNPLLLARKWAAASRFWQCWHCGFVATNDAEGKAHFGEHDGELPSCVKVEYEAQVSSLSAQLEEARRERDHWKANHVALRARYRKRAEMIKFLRAESEEETEFASAVVARMSQALASKQAVEGRLAEAVALLERVLDGTTTIEDGKGQITAIAMADAGPGSYQDIEGFLDVLSEGEGEQGASVASRGGTALVPGPKSDSEGDLDGGHLPPLGHFCPACEAIPQAGYCNLAGCPTAPKSDSSEGSGS